MNLNFLEFASPKREGDITSPLRELKRYNGVFYSPSKASYINTSPEKVTDKTASKLSNGFSKSTFVAKRRSSRLDSMAVGFTLDELLSSDSIEEYSLVETIDNCGAMGSFEKFFMPSPKKAVYCDSLSPSLVIIFLVDFFRFSEC